MIDLTLVITCFNNQQKLAKTLKSIESYDGNDVEIIVVDDGSSTIPSFSFHNLNIKLNLYRIEHRGPIYARIFGASKARGVYVYFIDSGDEIEITRLQAFCQKVVNDYFDVYLVNTLKKHDGESELNFSQLNENEISKEEMLIKIFSGPGGLTSSLVSKKRLFSRVFEEYGTYPRLIFNEDQFLSCKLVEQAKTFFQIDDYIYIYYVEDDSLSTSLWTCEKIDSYIYVYNFKKSFSDKEGGFLSDFLAKNELAGLSRNLHFAVDEKERLYFISQIKQNSIREVFKLKNIFLSKAKIKHKAYALYTKLRYKI